VIASVSASDECKADANEIWVSSRRTLLYQGDIPAGGSAEFHVMPGRTTLTVTGEHGCFAETELDAQPGRVNEVRLELALAKEARRLGELERASKKKRGRAPAQFYQYGGICPTCGQSFNNYGALPYFYAPMSYYPSWGSFGALSYPNFYSPGAWSGYGLSSFAYPYAGNLGVGKPNVYLSGPTGTVVKLKVAYPDASHALAAIPEHGDAGWSAKLESDGAVSERGAIYHYLHYDYRANASELQSARGFCAEREDLVPRLAQALSERGFTDEAIRDFRQYWSIKLPPGSQFCVFPQEERELARIAPLDVQPRPARIARELFVVIPKEALGTASAAGFSRPPEVAWKASERTPAAEGKTVKKDEDDAEGVTLREWGVAFPFSPEK
jgi:hypothetical protein